MSTDAFPQTQTSSEAPAGPPDRHRRAAPRGRWGIRVVAALGVLVIVVSAAALMSVAMSSSDAVPQMTHTITRGDLVVSVIEQGTLESSNNTEIKCKVRGFNTVTYVVPGGTVVQPGDDLVRLDTKLIEEAHSLTKTNTHIAEATLARSTADVDKAEIAIDAYLQGRYVSQKQSLQKELEICQTNLATAEKLLDQTELLFDRGYVNELEVEGNRFTVTQAELELKVKQTEIDVLERFTKVMQLESLQGNLTASRSKQQADEAGLAMEKKRRDRAAEELEACVIKADRAGLVIYPSAAAWKNAPDIDVGATVRKDQVLLLMPDLTKMQVEVGIHESVIDRVRPGLKTYVRLPDRTVEAEVSEVATVTQPAGWWTGNVVKYDTTIKLPSEAELKPGMSAEVEVIVARHENVLTVPVAAVVDSEQGSYCWVASPDGPKRRPLKLGDSNDVFIVVDTGLKEGDEVLLNAGAFTEDTDAATGGRQPDRGTQSIPRDSSAPDS